MLFQQLRRGFGMLFLLIGAFLFAWGAWPSGKIVRTLTILPREMQLASSESLLEGEDQTHISEVAAVPAVLEVRHLMLEAPVSLRAGDPGVVRLEFTPAPVKPESSETQGLKDIFDTHYAAVEARLEIGGIEVGPAGTLTRPLSPAEPARFEWDLVPLQKRVYEGTVWFYLRYLPKDGSPGTSQPVSAQRVEIRTASLFGLRGVQARLAGGVGFLFGLVLASDLLAGYIRKRISTSSSKLTTTP